MRSRVVAVSVPVLIGAMLLAGCGSKKETPSSGGTGAAAAGSKTVTIGLIAPLSGDLAAVGLGMRNSADLAIKQANSKKTIPGWTIKYEPQDDTADANTGAQAASKLSSDSSVVGVIGTLNSSVALQVQPILASKSIVEISPANTLPDLTQGKDYLTSKKRQFPNYFRVSTTDAIQGPFGADYVYKTLGKKTAVTVNDQLAYGVGLTANFERQYTKNGGKLLGKLKVSQGDKNFSAVVSKIKPLNPGVIYYGGQYPEGSLLAKQLKAAGVNAIMAGGDGLVDETFIKIAGKGAEGDVATNVGAPTASLKSAATFVSDYKAGGFKEPYATYGAYTYDATNVLIQAMKTALTGKTTVDASVRKAVLAAVQSTKISGATGQIGFDEFGDNTNRVLTVYAVKGGAFVPAKTASFNAG